MINQFTIFLAIYLILDALHDKYIIEGRTNVTNLFKERAWHYLDSVIKGFVAFTVVYLLGVNTWIIILYMVYFMAFRAVWFNLWLNIFRENVKPFHLGTKGIEGYFKNKGWGKWYWIGCFSLLVTIYLYLLK